MRARSRTALALALAASAATLAAAHGDYAEVDENPDATYAELHMAQEHHMDSFDIQAFFHLHDLNRDGVLDRNELESIYGVHHEKRRKGAKNLEVHTQQATEIVDQVLDRLDQNRDGVLTMREFVAGGVGGLPNFKGVEHLGHHYDAEGEYFLHHEERYHNTPETQREEDYHFMSHEAIEDEEDERIRQFTGEDPDIDPAANITPEQLEQHIFNELNGLPDEATTEAEKDFVHKAVADEDKHNPHAEMVKPREPFSAPPPVYNPDALRASGAKPRAVADPQQQQASTQRRQEAIRRLQDDGVTPSKAPTEQERARRERAEAARAQAAKFAREAREASARGAWAGEDQGAANFGRPKDAADRLRRNVPYKYKVRNSWFGEF
ncbi:hypothetical protein DMC30DRAFT_413073 [Rhodotorula diobovata]|uniref:EF-hand domain-containing protein n=1 Tax=Rhodotorula diobovata TaxID=5288 RepID=A0A5C5G5X0_9BASI|nr:hypothetical protein DMC30DRAFT_413073 [Rhodotorula diobovata]